MLTQLGKNLIFQIDISYTTKSQNEKEFLILYGEKSKEKTQHFLFLLFLRNLRDYKSCILKSNFFSPFFQSE